MAAHPSVVLPSCLGLTAQALHTLLMPVGDTDSALLCCSGLLLPWLYFMVSQEEFGFKQYKRRQSEKYKVGLGCRPTAYCPVRQLQPLHWVPVIYWATAVSL